MPRTLAILILAAGCTSAPQWHITVRFNRSWERATDPYDGRYEGLSESERHRVRHKELRFEQLLDDLTAMDGCGEDHGCYHILKENREEELWKLLESLPVYRGESDLILAAIDNVYLAYHWNGYWGYDWHWIYFNCFKAVTLADRLAARHPGAGDEALWTKVYCFRVGTLGKNQFTDTAAGKAQKEWTGSLSEARSLCEQLVRSYPNSRHAAEALRLISMSDTELSINRGHTPTFGPRPLPEEHLESASRFLGCFRR